MLCIKYINIVLIILILFLIGYKTYNIIEEKNHLNKIENIIYNGETNETNYIGYIEIKRLNIKRGIVNGINDYVLNLNDIGYENNGNIILAGHSIENVFGHLHKIKLGDVIYLYLYNKKIEYVVNNIKIVNKKDVSSLNNELNLITCMYNPDYRLIVGAKKNT